VDRKEFLENLGDTEKLAETVSEYIESLKSAEVSRRNFMKGAALMTGTAALSATGANLFNREILPDAAAQETEETSTKIQIKGNSDQPLNYYFRTTGPVRKREFEPTNFEGAESQTSTDTTSGSVGTGGAGYLSERLHHLMNSDVGVQTVEPGNLKQAVESLPKPTGGNTGEKDWGDIFYSMLKLQPGETYRPEEPITLYRGQRIHAEGATIEPQHDGPVFRMDGDTKVYEGKSI
jgi:hypothetical protein